MDLYEAKEHNIKAYKKSLELIKNSRAFRYYYFKDNFYSFALYYFSDYFKYPSADFHKQWCKDLQWEKNNFIIWARWIWKSVFIVIYMVWLIVYSKRHFILFYSYEAKGASGKLFDLVVHLQTNQRLIQDFGQLYNTKRKKEEAEKKTVWEFITSHGEVQDRVKVKSMSMWETARWLLYKQYRPDCIILDDIDNILSVKNPDVIDKNYDFLKWEVFGALDIDYKIVWLWNVISADGLVPRHKRDIDWNEKWTLSEVPIMKDNEIIWDRYVHTDEEAQEWLDRGVRKVSLESIKREQGENFKPNYLLIPHISSWNPVFNHDILQSIVSIKWTSDTKYNGLVYYKDPSPDLIWGVDTALWWENGDYSTITIRNYNLELVASYRGKIPPDKLSEIIKYLVDKWYEGLIWIENNNTWISTIDNLKNEYRYSRLLYSQKSIDNITNRPTNRYGFNTNAKSKVLIIEKLRSMIENRELTEFDEHSIQDLLNYYYDSKLSTNALKGAYDDCVISNAICLHMYNQPRQYIFA